MTYYGNGQGEIVELGAFRVKSGKLVVSDPCYSPGTWCQGTLDNVRKGVWKALVEVSDEGNWGQRVSTIIVHHESLGSVEAEDFTEKATFEVGVDSGQAGFWDAEYFCGGQGEYDELGTFYGDACTQTLRTKVGAGVMPGGCVSSSGYGDGGYECTYVKSTRGKVVAARVVFIEPEPERTYDNWEDDEEDDDE
jgi:hypothetical protein